MKTLQQYPKIFGALDALKEIRAEYLRQAPDTKTRLILQKLGMQIDQPETGQTQPEAEWTDPAFHLRNRIHLNRKSTPQQFEDLAGIYGLEEDHLQHIREIVKDGVVLPDGSRSYYDLSLLPLNMLLGKEVMQYFIPPADYFRLSKANQADPYGIINGKTRSKDFSGRPAAIKSMDSGLLLGTNKFTHTLLYNIDFYCPIGCSDCYKARMGTREYHAGDKAGSAYVDELGEVLFPTKATVIQQAKQTVMWMNHDERGKNIYDVIISGGEPLMLSNELIAGILSAFREAKNLKVLRICTGALFLGLPFRIDNALLQLLRDFSDATGVRVTIQAHIGNHHMISPESVMAIRRIRNYGFNIYAQVPIKNGVNFFLDDPGRTLRELSLLLKNLVIADVEPYMFIVDMHPSTNAYYVPIEPLLQTWGDLVESHDFPGLEKPRTLSILFSQGNIILSGNTLLATKKRVDAENNLVHYQIPRVGVEGYWHGTLKEVFTYTEPLILGINDDPGSLKNVSSKWV